MTGGEYALLKNKDDLDRTLSILATDFANSYMLSFRPTSSQTGFHVLELQLGGKSAHLRVAARSNYWISLTDSKN